jgi:hypothetical protein
MGELYEIAVEMGAIKVGSDIQKLRRGYRHLEIRTHGHRQHNYRISLFYFFKLRVVS